MKLLVTLLTILQLFVCYCASANVCNASFTYHQVNSNLWQFKSVQIQQVGYTYYHTWLSNGVVATNAEVYTRTYTSNGTYSICHIISVQDSTGSTLCIDTSCQEVTVIMPVVPPPCIPQFNIQSNINDLVVDFSLNLFSYTNLKIEWNFYDNNGLVTSAAPSYTYTSYGSKMVKVYVTDTVLNCKDSLQMNVYLQPPAQCQLAITGIDISQPSLSEPKIEFHPVIEGVYTTLVWTYGDAQISITNDTVHTYPQFTGYNFCLSLSDSVSGCTASFCNYLYIDTCNSYNGHYTYNQNISNNSIAFHGNATYTTLLYWNWDFGDGIQDNTTHSPAHTYNQPGTYTVCRTTKYNGCAESTYCDTITVNCLPEYTEISPLNTSSNTMLFNTDVDTKPNIKYEWSFGDGTVGFGRRPTHVYAIAGYKQVCLIATDTIFGCSDTICHVTLVKAWSDTICGYAFFDANANSLFDSNELPMQSINVKCRVGNQVYVNAQTDSTGYYMLIVPHATQLFISAEYPVASYAAQTLGSYFHTFQWPGIKNCGFNFGCASAVAEISGRIFADNNNNGVRDGVEKMLPYETVKVGNYYTATNSSGYYSIYLPVGTYTITKPSAGFYAGFPTLPVQISVSATAPGTVYGNNNIGIGIPTTYKDIAIDMIPTSTVSATRLATYQVLISNLSENTAYYQADLAADTILSYYAPYAANIDNYDVNSHTATWFGQLVGFGKRIIPIGYTVATTATINQPLSNLGSIALQFDTDQNPSNDTSRTQQVVVSSYDPNNKVPGNCGETERGYILASDKMQYTINFQNTGNDVAVNVIVKDVISPNLDINSLRFIATSHVNNFTLKVDGDTIYFIYRSIMLPDSLSNESGSKGWVSFSIQQKPNLAVGSEIKNTAAIYFDYNDAVITNTTLHTIALHVGINEAETENKLAIYPNPSSNKVSIEIPSNMADAELRITDIMGRHILSKKVSQPTEELNVSELASGIYFVSLSSQGRVLQSKLLVE